MKFACLLLLIAALGACASVPQVTTETAPGARLSAYHSYMWLRKPEADYPSLQEHIVGAVDEQLRASGWVESRDADIVVVANSTTSEKRTSSTVGGVDRGWGLRAGLDHRGEMGGRVRLSTPKTTVHMAKVASLEVDIVDAKTHQRVWRGTVSGAAPNSEEEAIASIDSQIASLFSRFPSTRKP
ncbi:MAG: DUF4136 domain-containing protein [Rhodanobacteraceae bacterium]